MSDTLFKRLQILKMLPIFPTLLSASDIHRQLESEGFTLTKRTVQRDLNDLAKIFSIESDGNKDIPGWYWLKGAEKIEFPKMEPTVALTFQMVKTHLQAFMPPSVMADLSGYFASADTLLSGLKDNSLSDWSTKTATLSRTQPLIAPKIDADVLSNIYMALLSETQITAHYQPKLKELREYTINPLGIVVVDQVIYLLGTLWEYSDINQFALHRFKSVENTTTEALNTHDFDLQHYIDEGKFYFPIPDQEKTINLKITANVCVAKHLEEVRLAENQIMTPIGGTKLFEISATIGNTHQLRWWLQSFGENVEIIEPEALREEFVQITRSLCIKYLEK